MLIDTWLYFRACVSHWARVDYSLLSNSSGIRSSGVHVSVVTVDVMLNRAGLPGNPPSLPWEPSKSSLFSFYLFIYLVSFQQGSGTGCSCFLGYFVTQGWARRQTVQENGFYSLWESQCIRGKKMCSTFSPHDESKIHVEINQKYPWHSFGFCISFPQEIPRVVCLK